MDYKQNIRTLLKELQHHDNDASLQQFIKYNESKCNASKSNILKHQQCHLQKKENMNYCGKHKNYSLNNKKSYCDYILDTLKNNNHSIIKDLSNIVYDITDNNSIESATDNNSIESVTDNNSIESATGGGSDGSGSDNTISEIQQENNGNKLLKIIEKYSFLDLYTSITKMNNDIGNTYENGENDDKDNLDTVSFQLHNSIVNTSTSISTSISTNNRNEKYSDMCDNGYISINNDPFKKKKIILRKSLVSSDYYKTYLKQKNSMMYSIPNINEKYITLLDYFENDSLDSNSDTKLISTFTKYRLYYTGNQLIDLEKLKKSGDENDKLLYKRQKIVYTTIQLKSLFETMIIALNNYESLLKIQKNYKIFKIRKNIRMRGLACYNRSICVNETDFYSLDPISEISISNFYSYTDDAKFTYGFHIDSIWELTRRKNRVKNPYNRDVFRESMKDSVNELYKLKRHSNTLEKKKLSIQLIVKSRCIDLFSKIDMFGYQTQIKWLYDKSPSTLRLFYRKLFNLWNHRLCLSAEMKEKILPGMDVITMNRTLSNPSSLTNNKFKLLDKILGVLDALMSQSSELNDRNMGAIIILHALAEISPECVESNTWLQ